jgi:hypothetical protein
MTHKQISSVVTALRPLQVDLNELTNEINELWSQLRAIQRTRFEDRERIATIVRLNLTNSIEKLQVCSEMKMTLLFFILGSFVHTLGTYFNYTICASSFKITDAFNKF